MTDFTIEYYLVIKALHLISIICWMAALLYLPRLFVYHTAADIGSDMYKTFLIMEFKLMRYIMTPSMLASFLFGGLLLYTQDFHEGWLHAKLLLVLLMAALHGFMIKCYGDFNALKNKHSDRFFRICNEVPAVIMILVVLLVTLKPF